MTLKEFYEKEKHVALNAQPRRFRVGKWIVILLVAIALYSWNGWVGVVWLAAFCIIVGTSLHFFLRYKTEGWTKSWGPYKEISFDK